MNGSDLSLRVAEVGSAQWSIAVQKKRERAYRALERDGMSRQQIEQRHEAYRTQRGLARHDERLRQEVRGGQLFTWWHAEQMVAYAPAATNLLLGDESHRVFDVVDVWAEPWLTQAQREQIVSDLRGQAQAAGAMVMQIKCDHTLFEANRHLGGQPVKHCFQFHFSREQKTEG